MFIIWDCLNLSEIHLIVLILLQVYRQSGLYHELIDNWWFVSKYWVLANWYYYWWIAILWFNCDLLIWCICLDLIVTVY